MRLALEFVNRIARCILFTGCIVALTGQNAADAADRGKMSTNKKTELQVKLSVDRPLYRLMDEMKIQVLIANKSNSPLNIYSPLEWGESASVSIWVRNSTTGKDISQSVISDALQPPSFRKEDFILLPPNHVYGVLLTCTLKDLNISMTGRYELSAEYHSPVTREAEVGLDNVWYKERGKLTSNVVVVDVR